MKRFQKFRNTVYFDKFKIMILNNGRFVITDLNFNIIDDLKGQGYKTRQRAINSLITKEKKWFYNMKKMSVKVNSVEEYILVNKVFLMMGGYAHNGMSLNPDDKVKEFILKYNKRHTGDLFFTSIYSDGEIHWWVGSIHTFNVGEIYLDISDFKKSHLGYFREITLNSIGI
jgi:hypothetical protein